MAHLFSLSIAAAISLAIIPVMAALAPRLGLVDHPDERKVHARPVPRVGGWGIVGGTVIAILLWLPMNPLLIAFLFGTAVLFFTGTWDDRTEIGHYPKFVSQFVAVLPLVIWADLEVLRLPFMADPLPASVAIPFTIFALVGMINAVNHSDGLDGLAGGEALLSLAALGTVAWLAGDSATSIISVAAVGAIVGFLRHNDHPASLFMGDAGSQFLGFTIGVLAVLITSRVDPSLSPSVVLLLLGLPVIDILVVFAKRVTSGENWFRASRNHIHHRLLDLGMTQRAAVMLIYAVHASMVISGIFLRHADDVIILATYATICTAFFLGLYVAENTSRTISVETGPFAKGKAPAALGSETKSYWLVGLPRQILTVLVPGYLLVLVIIGDPPAPAYAAMGLPLASLMLIEGTLTGNTSAIVSRALLYASAAYVVYGSELTGSLVWQPGVVLVIAFLLGVAILFSPRRRRFEFRPSGVDLLAMITLGTGAMVSHALSKGFGASALLLQLVVIFYAIELFSVERRGRNNPYKPLLFGVVLAMVFRGLA